MGSMELPYELDLHKLSAEEAIIELDRFLSESYGAGLLSVRIIHGKGTGVLRRIVREQAVRHPLVKSYRPAFLWEGGNGATILQLID
jgi:DNA mismatch repair protein MutS2